MQHPHKLKDEIKGRKEIFKSFLQGKGKLYCRGERCSYCVLNYFCRDMELLVRKGSIGILPPPGCNGMAGPLRGAPPFAKGGGPAGGPHPAGTPPGKFALKSANDLEKFLDFFILHRYRVKSIRCRTCAFSSKCRGGNIFYVREHGFKSLKPMP